MAKSSKLFSRQKRRTQQSEPQSHVPTYRRNRTMTDRSSLPDVSERTRAHYIRQLRRRVGAVLLVVIVLAVVSIAGILQYSGSVVVTNRNPSITKQMDGVKYKDLFAAYYQRYPLERFRFMTDYERLLASIQQEAPEVKSIEPAGTDRLGVSRYDLTVRQPVARWSVDTNQRYYVDAEGVTFTKNYYAEPGVSVIDNSGASVAQGSAIASSRLLSFVGRIVALSSERGVSVTAIEIPAGSMRQIYVKGKGFPVVRMTIDREVGVQVNDMAAALSYLKKHNQKPSYIDVRVEGKAFYK